MAVQTVARSSLIDTVRNLRGQIQSASERATKRWTQDYAKRTERGLMAWPGILRKEFVGVSESNFRYMEDYFWLSFYVWRRLGGVFCYDIPVFGWL